MWRALDLKKKKKQKTRYNTKKSLDRGGWAAHRRRPSRREPGLLFQTSSTELPTSLHTVFPRPDVSSPHPIPTCAPAGTAKSSKFNLKCYEISFCDFFFSVCMIQYAVLVDNDVASHCQKVGLFQEVSKFGFFNQKSSWCSAGPGTSQQTWPHEFCSQVA